MTGRFARAAALGGSLALAVLGLGARARAEGPPPSAAQGAQERIEPSKSSGEGSTAPDVGTARPADLAARAATEAAAAQATTAELEAQVIELRRAQEALARERASYDDVRRRLDELEARLSEAERRQAVASYGVGGSAPNAATDGLIRFQRDQADDAPGFIIRSSDGRFVLRPRLWLQSVYTGALADRGSADAASPDVSSFGVAHAQAILEGYVGSPRFEYRLQLDAARPPPDNESVLDAFVQWRATRALAVRAGHFKVPFGMQRLTWRAELQFADISAPMSAFSLERDTGLMLLGQPLGGRLQYEAALINGSGLLSGNDNRALAYAVRLVAAPFGRLPEGEGDIDVHGRPLLSVGVSGYYNLVPTDVRARLDDPSAPIDVNGDGRVDNVAVWQGGVELRALWRGAALQGEWFGRIEDPGVASSARHFWGAYGQASAFVVPRRLEVAARIGRTDLPLYGATADARARAGNRVDEQAGAVNAYLRGRLTKIAIDYTHLEARDAISAPQVHRVRAWVQLGF